MVGFGGAETFHSLEFRLVFKVIHVTTNLDLDEPTSEEQILWHELQLTPVSPEISSILVDFVRDIAIRVNRNGTNVLGCRTWYKKHEIEEIEALNPKDKPQKGRIIDLSTASP